MSGRGKCPVWWMSGVVNVWCSGCPILHIMWWISYSTHGVGDIWCGGCLVWWLSYNPIMSEKFSLKFELGWFYGVTVGQCALAGIGGGGGNKSSCFFHNFSSVTSRRNQSAGLIPLQPGWHK